MYVGPMYVCICARVYVYMYTCMYACVRRYVYVYMHDHVCMHAGMQSCIQLNNSSTSQNILKVSFNPLSRWESHHVTH